jgi:hypothetical protein
LDLYESMQKEINELKRQNEMFRKKQSQFNNVSKKYLDYVMVNNISLYINNLNGLI